MSLTGTPTFGAALQEDRLMLTDPAGVQHVMKECYSYPKPPEVRGPLSRILGKGLQHAEGSSRRARRRAPLSVPGSPRRCTSAGDDHRRQKKIMSPAFSTAHLRDLTPTFFDVAHKVSWRRVTEFRLPSLR